MMRTKDLFTQRQQAIYHHTDRMFAVLMVLQWLGGIAIALWISPRTWAGASSAVHIHVLLAVLLGGSISSFPIALAMIRPGKAFTRYTIATAQLLMSSLLIHLMGGRIEAHFHVFGSLAFLSIYRDWRVFIPSTIVVAADHFLRGLFWPQSVYGVSTDETWRWLEHAGWVVFQNTFLLIAIRRSRIEMWETASRTAEIENLNEHLEQRTGQLGASNLELEREVEARRKAEAQLAVYNNKLQQSNRELQDFAHVASHDLQEPLRKIETFSERLKAKYAYRLEGEGLDYLERMQNAAGRMRTLICDLLTLARVTSKARPFEPVDLEKLVKEILSDLEIKIEESDATVNVANLPIVDADPIQMRQLMQNLIGNALKFQRQGITPVINVFAEPPNSDKNGHGQLLILVEDNGIGFDQKHTDKIFAPFHRLHERTAYEGSGIGLAVCRKIVERHNGSLTARSAPDQGATFTITIPTKQTDRRKTNDSH